MKKLVLVSVVWFATVSAFGQISFGGNPLGLLRGNQNDSSDMGSRFYVGGGGSLGFGTGYNYYALFPIVGYRVTSQFSAGTGVTYQRYNYTGISTGNYSFTQYGITPFLRYNFNPLFFQMEYNLINAPSYNSNNEIVRAYYSRLLFGIGYAVPLGQRSKLNAMLMYDVLYRQPSVFNSPIVARVFFTL